ncbi:MAG: Two-component system, OmpR family, sensor histidine kinase TctE [Devosia sp.]|uniref:ABC transporter substrate-binding protein n=1 Tax=Devosia sp. TaxID=1871048 RepID=UPI002622D9C9|nr:ABC transporter substrate-binding protein [Devosia sp.]MDB5528424.1 Two-component system, OmpR family, sensor histidine kinase TctE [Devosia sp.]
MDSARLWRGAIVIAMLSVAPVMAASTYPAPNGQPSATLTIVGTTDEPLFRHFIEGFQREHADIAVVYDETDTLPLFQGLVAGTLALDPDLIVSSAADLQMKLANDGYALAYDSPWLDALPTWARWRNEVFGFTFEPAVIVYNPALISAEDVPRTHLGLAELLETQTARFAGKIATYDIGESGVGYLLAANDQFISSNFWRLASAFGRAKVRLSGSSPRILDAVDSGELALAYNVLGSYAFARRAESQNIQVVVPDDYVLVLTRSMLIPRSAPRADLGKAFVDFALSPAGQAIAAGPTALGALAGAFPDGFTSATISARGRGALQPIAIGPSLLVSLDQQRRDRFLATWREIVAPGSATVPLEKP